MKKLSKKQMTPKWDIDEAKCNMWIAFEPNSCFLQDFRRVHGYGVTHHMTVFYPNGLFRWCTPYQENINLGRNLLHKMMRSKKYLTSVIRGFNRHYKAAFNYFKKIDKLDLRKISDKDLFNHLRHLKKLYRHIWLYGFTIEPMDAVLPEIFEKEINKYKLPDKDKIILMAVPEKSLFNEEKENLLKIGQKAEKSGLRKNFPKMIRQPDIYRDIVEHRQKYKWLMTGHAGKKEIKVTFFIKELKKYLYSDLNISREIQKISQYKQKILKDKRLMIRKYHFDKKSLILLKIINRWGPLHDLRKKVFMHCIYYIETILEEIGRRYNYSLKELRHMNLDEILNFEKGQLMDKQKIKERMGLDVLIFNRHGYRLLVGKKAKVVEKKEIQSMFKKVKTVLLKGNSANPGVAKGKVKVIYGLDEMKKMKKGDILVTGMTRPELAPVIKMASAIVTDEGGITCHAAIVSRELGIPCIVGTKIATQVLKDGDKVEVDANKGIIKKTMSKLVTCGAWDLTPLISWPWQAALATKHFYKLTGYRIRAFTYLKDKLHWQYFFSDEVNRLQKYFNRLSESAKKRYVERIFRNYYVYAKRAKKLLGKLEKINYKKLSTNELFFWLKKLYDSLALTTMQIWFALFLDKWYPMLDDSFPFKKIAAQARDYSAYLHGPARPLKKKLYNEVARRLKIPPGGDIFYLLPEEIVDCAKDRRDILKRIPQRKKFFVTATLTNQYKIYEGRKARQLLKLYLPAEQEGKVQILKGFAAYPGQVRGKVHKVIYHKEFSKFKRGEILVALQTLVSYVPIMKKAKAILTEFGGITSHAAVVSRELKKPCIVGISHLTVSLSDKDRVLVDASRGIVKKL